MKLLSTILLCFILFGCATRKYPAPIVQIDQAGSSYTERNKASLTQSVYEVQKGETLYSISWRAGIDYRLLAQINNISEPYDIFPGQQLALTKNTVIDNKNRSQKQPVTIINTTQKNNKKTIAKENSEEYGKKQTNQKVKKQVQKEPIKKSDNDSFPHKVRKWQYPSDGKIIDTYSTKENGNRGIDFGGRPGDPIIAAADGKVVYAGSALRGFGNLIIVKHNNDYLSAYAHNRALLVKEQDWVKAGQVIAEMGSSGTDKVKLHFEIRFRGRTVNPLKYLPKKR
ncbi:peptidoglycan DD-metalloendopeptidase family protein [Psychrosphaera aestuarii]|uniref:peptidoglycan DD-metalloendopeptidase family protein n=1 Tax=Psychrosphaera aestuarii TaxID=1266052 RepID=UPI001B32D19E|nr:peptidoglycan DD-metalloendopeptidase family protein [Psychrosphaera aestuarii]